MHLRFSFFQPSSHFSWDTHSKQSFRLDEEGFLWLSFCSFGPWSNSFDLYRTLHALNVISSCILCILYLFVCIVLFFILLLCFSFVWVIQNHIKWKIQKVWSYLFEHISHVSLTLYFCTNGFVHFRALLVIFALISLWEKSWYLCVIVVNRSSSLSWMICQ